MHQTPAEPEVWFPSEEVEIILGITRESIHHQSGQRDENGCSNKDFHLTIFDAQTLLNIALQNVLKATFSLQLSGNTQAQMLQQRNQSPKTVPSRVAGW